MRNLSCEKQKDNKYDPSLELKPRRSDYIHAFDALTYPIMYYDVRQTFPQVSTNTKYNRNKCLTFCNPKD